MSPLFDFQSDVLAPVVAALLQAQNEYAWNAPSCPEGTVMIVLGVLSGRCDSMNEAMEADGGAEDDAGT